MVEPPLDGGWLHSPQGGRPVRYAQKTLGHRRSSCIHISDPGRTPDSSLRSITLPYLNPFLLWGLAALPSRWQARTLCPGDPWTVTQLLHTASSSHPIIIRRGGHKQAVRTDCAVQGHQSHAGASLLPRSCHYPAGPGRQIPEWDPACRRCGPGARCRLGRIACPCRQRTPLPPRDGSSMRVSLRLA